jgi:hypothetical protein
MSANNNGHRLAEAPTAPVYIIDGRQLHDQVSAMAATLVRTETLLAAHLEAEREERDQRRQDAADDDARFTKLEQRVWSIPGAGTLIALAGVVVAILSLKGG